MRQIHWPKDHGGAHHGYLHENVRTAFVASDQEVVSSEKGPWTACMYLGTQIGGGPCLCPSIHLHGFSSSFSQIQKGRRRWSRNGSVEERRAVDSLADHSPIICTSSSVLPFSFFSKPGSWRNRGWHITRQGEIQN